MSPFRSNVATRAVSALLLAASFVTACDAPTAVPFPGNAVRMDPPPVYQLWWSLVERCSGLTGDFNAVRFYEEPGQYMATAGTDSANAYWFASGNRIVVGGMSTYDGPVIRHEMLHALIGPSGDGGHPRLYFVQRCGGIVHCGPSCLTSEGPLPVPGPGAPEVAPSTLDVRVRVDPAPFDAAKYGGWMAVTVSARNPLPQALWVSIPMSGAHPGEMFGYSIGGRATDWMGTGESRIPFQAGETQQHMFDVKVAPGLVQLDPGSYDVRGFFASDTTSPSPLVVLPPSP